MLDREIKYTSSVSHELETKLVPQPLRVHRHNLQVKKTVADEQPPLPRTLVVRSVTARIRRKDPEPPQEKYQLAQKNFVLEL